MPFKRAITYSLAINLFFLALCLIFGDLKFGAIDDYFMAARLTGALGTDYNPHLIFVNAIYGYALLPLYHLFTKVGWYYIGEMFSVFLSFTVIGYVFAATLWRAVGSDSGHIVHGAFRERLLFGGAVYAMRLDTERGGDAAVRVWGC